MYLGIDLGTSSMKCLLIGEDQEPLKTVSSEEIPLSSPHSGWSEQDPKLWIKALDQCLLKLRQEINLKQIIFFVAPVALSFYFLEKFIALYLFTATFLWFGYSALLISKKSSLNANILSNKKDISLQE